MPRSDESEGIFYFVRSNETLLLLYNVATY